MTATAGTGRNQQRDIPKRLIATTVFIIVFAITITITITIAIAIAITIDTTITIIAAESYNRFTTTVIDTTVIVTVVIVIVTAFDLYLCVVFVYRGVRAPRIVTIGARLDIVR